jgi:5-methylcytosine-specific restriction enzyme subunit McrC
MADIKIKNIYYMLSYAFHSLRESELVRIDGENFDNIHDLFAAILVRGVGAQIKRGLHRAYQRREEALAGLRGQVRVTETIKRQRRQQGKLVCVYDELAFDSPYNQILKSVMNLLIRHGKVNAENKKALRKLLPYFAETSEIMPAAIRWQALQYHRHNASYRTLLAICRLTIKGLLLTSAAGAHKLASWLQDEEMFRLYEKFVLAYYVRHHPEFQPRSAFIDWDIDQSGAHAHLPLMKSDICLKHGEKKLIIDTKYYRQTMREHPFYNKPKFIADNLYQIYAYVKNSDKGATGKVAGVLLYAKTEEAVTPDADFLMGGSPISVKTLDLNRDWPAITEQLEKLCLWLQTA